MRIGIDCDGVLRDLITGIVDGIKTTHPQHTDKILEPNSWNWEDWLPFWTEEEAEQYIFEDNYLDFFGVECPPIEESVQDWNKLRTWATENNHELILVSAQRPHCKEPTREWLKKYGFDFDEMHYTKHKWSIDVDVLIDDSPEKMNKFADRSVNYGRPICYKQTWNQDSQKKYMSIDRLSDIMTRLFG